MLACTMKNKHIGARSSAIFRVGKKGRRSEGGRTFELEGKVVGQMSALVVPSEEEECRRVVNLERPKVENALPESDERSGFSQSGKG